MDDVVLIDGGLSTALADLGHDLNDALWTARLVDEQPDAIIDAHLAFLHAGARVIITASYQASVPSLTAAGFSPRAADALLRRSTDLAKQAVRRFGEHDPRAAMRVRIAASVGPYGAVMANGAEYTGDYPIDDRQLREFHRDRMAVLADTGPDLFAIETIPSVAEAEAIVTAMADLGHRVAAWMCFSARSASETCSGDPIEQAARCAASSPAVEAVGVNCTAPHHVASLLSAMAQVTSLPLVAYPNHGGTWDSPQRQWHGAQPEPDAAVVASWVAAGARYVGGCCGVGVEAISRLGDTLHNL